MSASISNYTELKTAIADFLERDDLTNYIDYFIDMAEDRFKRDIRFREIQVAEEFALSTDDRLIDLSTLTDTFNDIKSLRIRNPNVQSGPRYIRDLTYVPVTEMTELSLLDSYLPTHYTIWAGELELNCPVDQDYTADFYFYKELTPLDDTNTSNELLVRASDIYLFGSLSATAVFLHEDERLSTWESLYTNAKDALRKSENDQDRPGPVVARVEGPPKQITRYRWR